MKLSVIIPSYQSGAYLERCLSPIIEQSQGTGTEVVVVDSSETVLPETFKNKFPLVKFIQSPKRLFAGAARNSGVQNSSGNVLYFIDSDCMWNKNWYSNAIQFIETYSDWIAFNGPVFYEDPNVHNDALALHLLEFHELLSSKPYSPRFLHSGNLIIRRDTFEKVGGFREDIPMCTDFSFFARMDQTLLGRVYYRPELSVTHMAHLVEPTKVYKKIEKMGFWRGKIDRQLPTRLQLSAKPEFPVLKCFLAPVFFLEIFRRSVSLNSFYLSHYFMSASRLWHFCQIWAKGFRSGFDEGMENLDSTERRMTGG